MAQSFELAAMTLLLQRLDLTEAEKSFLGALKLAAEADSYWHTLSRFHRAFEAETDPVVLMQNIAARARMAGLAPVLEALKDDLGT